MIQKPNIVAVLNKEGIELKQRGKYFWALCPLHTEKNPSFKVDPIKQTFYCFGCQAHGDVISFTMLLKGLSFKEALNYLGIKKDRLPVSFRELTKRDLIRGFREWCNTYYGHLATIYRLFNQLKIHVKTMKDVELLTPYYHREPLWEYWMDILAGEDDELKFLLYRETLHGK